MKSGIYKITNLDNQKCYIGYSNNISRRWKEHKTRAFNVNSAQYNSHFYRAIRKSNDLSKWKFEVLEECPIKMLPEREKYWIKYYDSANPNKGYNETLGGETCKIVKITEKEVQKIQDLLLNKTDITEQDIAKLFQVSNSLISQINTGVNWFNPKLTYPLRKKEKAHYYCPNCGKEILRRSNYCTECQNKKRSLNISHIPLTKEELKNKIRTTPFTTIGKEYGVSDNAVRRWCDKFNLPKKTSEIKKYSNEEWEKI